MELSIPTKLSEIKLSHYQRFVNLEGDEEFLTRKALQIFCEVEHPEKVPYKNALEAVEIIYSTLESKAPLLRFFEYDDRAYGFIPDMTNMTLGELVDLDSTLNWNDMHKAMSVLFREITRSHGDFYEVKEYSGMHEEFKELGMDVVMGAVVFFWTLQRDLSSSFLKSMAEKEMTRDFQDAHNSGLSGDGTRRLIHSLAEMLQSIER